ncbi:MAG: SRPBCC domain-containing protein [Chloroflexi bacterium]|nr:SRPBCC domain-containing protein [Chloroflexota bacterium]
MSALRSLTLTEAVHINAPPDRVWAVFRDIRAWPEWNPVCLRVWNVSPTLWEVGSRFSFTLRMAGVPVSFQVTVIAADPPHRVAWSSRVLTITGTRTIAFTPEGAGTRATDTKEFSSPLLPLRLFYPRPIIHRMAQASLLALKRRVEAGRPAS